MKKALVSGIITAFLFSSLSIYAANIEVNSLADDVDNDGECTLREAVASADTDSTSGPAAGECGAGSGTDTITFSSSGTITRSTVSPFGVNTAMTIDGTGQSIVIDGNSSLMFDVNSPANLTIKNLTITNCMSGSAGGAIESEGILTITNSTLHNNSAYLGGAVYSANKLTITNSVVENNSASNDGAGIYNKGGTLIISNTTFSTNKTAPSGVHRGGAIYSDNTGTLEVTNSTFVDNEAHSFLGEGGAIYIAGTGSVTNSTFYGNSTIGAAPASFGGAICIASGGALTMTNCTLSNNTATTGGGIYNYSGATLHLLSTIIANSPSGGDCVNHGTITTNSINLIEDASCSAALSGDPKLGSLRDNGGGTSTMALLEDSPAIDIIPAGTNGCGSTIINDQRGKKRPQKNKCDIGAFEVVQFPWPMFLPAIINNAQP